MLVRKFLGWKVGMTVEGFSPPQAPAVSTHGVRRVLALALALPLFVRCKRRGL